MPATPTPRPSHQQCEPSVVTPQSLYGVQASPLSDSQPHVHGALGFARLPTALGRPKQSLLTRSLPAQRSQLGEAKPTPFES